MSNASTQVSPGSAPPPGAVEITAIDTTARWPLLLLIWAGLKWLLLAGIFALIASIQLHTPTFLSGCAWFTHGRLVALAETAFVYGWVANAGLALALWMLGRLGGSPLRALNWTVGGTLLWNLAVAIGCVGIALGHQTSVPYFQLPRYVQPLLFAGHAAIAVAGVLAWNGRRSRMAYASQWYAAAALFLFPWLLSAAQVVLLWNPVRGVLQPVAAGWFAQGVWTLWLAPLALGVGYYLVPRITGRALPSYEYASLGFWLLMFVGGLTGGRHLIGGPVPAWIPTVAIGACFVLLTHHLVIFLNLRGAFSGGGTVLRLVACGLVAYVLGGILEAVASLRGVAEVLQFTHFVTAQQQLSLYGAVSLLLFAGIYFALPRLLGQPWPSGALAKGHVVAVSTGVALLVLSLAVAGWIQGQSLADPEISFARIAARTRLWLVVATAAQGLLLTGNMLLVANFVRAVCSVCCRTANADSIRQPAPMEAQMS